MKLRQTINGLLIALFVWAIQSSTIHFQHNVIDEISECNLCDTFEKINIVNHINSIVRVNENLAINTRKHVEKVVVKPKFVYSGKPYYTLVDIGGNRQYLITTIPLGYLSTAPPYIFS